MKTSKSNKQAAASRENLVKIFTVAEHPESTLGTIDREITQNLVNFLQERIVATTDNLSKIEKDFSNPDIPEEPSFVSEYTEFLMESLVAQSVHTSAPGFVGHMSSALPNFMLPLSRIMTALNQNLVKIETSKAFTPMERQTISMLHKLVYEQDNRFYKKWMHDPETALGSFCSGGTIANMTALWVARNNLFPATEGFKGIAYEGLHRALKFYGYNDVAILVSRRGHYSFSKAADLLGIGRESVISIDTDTSERIDLVALKKQLKRLQEEGTRVISIIGIAGTTETGAVDPLDDLAGIAAEIDAHFHVDAAWGGPTLFSRQYKHLLKGIERADSVTIDAHKQMYVPMGVGMVLFKNPASLTSIEHHAEYVLRRGSKDLGSHTLEGSRPGMAMLVHAALNVVAQGGYELLIDGGIEKARAFADYITKHPDFELITKPELNLLTYRYVPQWLQQEICMLSIDDCRAVNLILDKVTGRIQKLQRAAGKSFVSRTRITVAYGENLTLTVFRVVIANPLTEEQTLAAILDEQEVFAQSDKKLKKHFKKIRQLIVSKPVPDLTMDVGKG